MSRKHVPFRSVLSICICKLARSFLRIIGKGGTALPGKFALAFDREVLAKASEGMHVILVTGTNGKTTTSRILEAALLNSGKSCLLNRSGANLLSGITAEFVCETDRSGNPCHEYAVIECDEGALKQVVPLVKPEIIVVTNLFRDQLDRYGEVMHTREEILKGIALAPESVLCLNADCPLTASLGSEKPNRIHYFGINTAVGDQQERELSDARYCIRCGAPLSYRYYTYAHLGSYSCPACGLVRPIPEVAAEKILGLTEVTSLILLKTGSHTSEIRVGLPAVYNLYNALAAICAGWVLGLSETALSEAVGHTRACFGRLETFDLKGIRIQMILIKNPAGCSQAVDYVSAIEEDFDLVFCLNDKTADGHDISWIWDADLEKLAGNPHRKAVFVSGSRAEDMQLRLKYAGIPENAIRMEKDYPALLRLLKKESHRVFVLPNYTAMLEIRKAFLTSADGEEFWKG
ncbi:MAG: DUF1727 domain-containing protein [Blautia sp.]|nr:DUF1727 domain-containing protein [Blautia sp.]